MNSYWITDLPRLLEVRLGIKMTLNPMLYYDDEMDLVIEIEPGFHTDGASVPWPITKFWSRWDPVTLADSILHDYGYSCRKKLSKKYGHLDKWTKESIDRRFYKGLRSDKPYIGACEIGRAKVYHFAVSNFGFFAWNRPNIKEVKE